MCIFVFLQFLDFFFSFSLTVFFVYNRPRVNFCLFAFSFSASSSFFLSSRFLLSSLYTRSDYLLLVSALLYTSLLLPSFLNCLSPVFSPPVVSVQILNCSSKPSYCLSQFNLDSGAVYYGIHHPFLHLSASLYCIERFSNNSPFALCVCPRPDPSNASALAFLLSCCPLSLPSLLLLVGVDIDML